MRFPRKHIATSVAERIIRARDVVAIQGMALDAALMQPVIAPTAPEGAEAAITQAAVEGASAADAVVGMGIVDAMQ